MTSKDLTPPFKHRDSLATIDQSIWLDERYGQNTLINNCVESDEMGARKRTATSEHYPAHHDAQQHFRTALKTVVGSFAFQLSLRFKDKNFVAISLNNNGLKGVEFSFTPDILKKAVSYLEDEGYIEIAVKGYIDRNTGEGFVSRYKATDKLVECLELHHCLLLSYPKQTRLKFEPVDSVVRIVKGKRKKEVDNRTYTEVPNDPSVSTILALRNLIDKSRITIGPVSEEAMQQAFDYKNDRLKFYPVSKQIYRQYSQSINSGGRFILSNVQKLPKAVRPYLLIDGAKTSELDYGSMQLNLALRLEGLEPSSEDLYGSLTCERIDREEVKRVLVTALGESSEEAFIRHQAHHAKHVQAGGSVHSAPTVIDRFIELYPALEKYLFSASWSVLQHEESNIALNVMRDLVEEGVVVLPIHESFIVKRKHEKLLREVMNRHFPGCPVN